MLRGRTPVAQVHAFLRDPVDVVVIYAIVETFFMYSWAVAPAQGGSANCYPDRAFPGGRRGWHGCNNGRTPRALTIFPCLMSDRGGLVAGCHLTCGWAPAGSVSRAATLPSRQRLLATVPRSGVSWRRLARLAADFLDERLARVATSVVSHFASSYRLSRVIPA